MIYVAVSHCGNEHSQWLKSLVFYDEELNTLDKRLLEIVKKNNHKEVMASVEHFQNQFVVQRNNIDELQHYIHEHENQIAAEAKANDGKMGITKIEEHKTLKGKVEIFDKVFNELRLEFNQFLSRWM